MTARFPTLLLQRSEICWKCVRRIEIPTYRLFSQSLIRHDIFSFYQNVDESDCSVNDAKLKQREKRLDDNIAKNTTVSNIQLKRYREISLRRRHGSTRDVNGETAARNSSLSFFPAGTEAVPRVTSPVKPVMKGEAFDDVVDSYTKSFVAKLFNVPLNATFDDIAAFFDGATLNGGKSGITFTYDLCGRKNGLAFVAFASKNDLDVGLKYSGSYMGKKKVAVIEVKTRVYEEAKKRYGDGGTLQTKTGYFINMRSLPQGTTEEDIYEFFKPFTPLFVETKMLSRGRARADFFCHSSAEEAMIKRAEMLNGVKVILTMGTMVNSVQRSRGTSSKL